LTIYLASIHELDGILGIFITSKLYVGNSFVEHGIVINQHTAVTHLAVVTEDLINVSLVDVT